MFLCVSEALATGRTRVQVIGRDVNGGACTAVTQTRSLDTESQGVSHATGFVVDKERGIILTNRHVVTPGLRPLLDHPHTTLGCLHAVPTQSLALSNANVLLLL